MVIVGSRCLHRWDEPRHSYDGESRVMNEDKSIFEQTRIAVVKGGS